MKRFGGAGKGGKGKRRRTPALPDLAELNLK